MPEPQSITWKEFFQRHAPHYDRNPFTQNTRVELQFIQEALNLVPGESVLDIGCGTGRHSVGLAAAGLKVTGIDFSPEMLAIAKERAAESQVEVEWIEADATEWSRQNSFDAAICLCEGGFGLINQDQDGVTHDVAILKNIYESLKPGGQLLLNALNGFAMIRRLQDEDIESGAFQPDTMTLFHVDEMNLPEGTVAMIVKERLFIPSELIAMMRFVGFEVQNLWGGTAGEWGRRPLKLDEIEMMVRATKKGG